MKTKQYRYKKVVKSEIQLPILISIIVTSFILMPQTPLLNMIETNTATKYFAMEFLILGAVFYTISYFYFREVYYVRIKK
jgi:ABC-type sulfate transport system permease subunit